MQEVLVMRCMKKYVWLAFFFLWNSSFGRMPGCS
ncbi:hypothetical protein T266_08315 [Pseudomonas aeruginosa VRFPA05]|nr:hypothetical protein T266_08315 [Pseudomonas aeruginosa VRFPA05]